MGEPEDVAVADAGPLIHLFEISRLALLHVFSVVYLPQSVWEEATAPARVPQVALDELKLSQVCEVDSTKVADILVAHRSKLHRGELDALALCQSLGVRVMLTDDMSARDAAKEIGVHPVGSLGIVIRAFRRGQISLTEGEAAILQLYEISTLFVTRAIAELAIEELRRFP